jgi:hypothetical protein
MIDGNLLETNRQINEVRLRMATSVLNTGSYDARDKTEGDALSCSLSGLHETLKCLQGQLKEEEQTRQKELKEVKALRAKIAA